MSCSRSSGMSNSDRLRWNLTEKWFEFVLTWYNIRSAATWRRWRNDKKVRSGQSLATEYTKAWEAEYGIQQQTPTPENNTQGLGEQMQSNKESNTEVSTKSRFTNLKIPIIWETRETIPRRRSSKVSLLSNFTPRMSRLALPQMETADKTKSPWGGLTVLDLLTTKAFVLFGFCTSDCITPESKPRRQ